MDDTGAVLWKRAPDRRLPNASTTKIVTALAVMRRASLDERVTVSRNAADTGAGGFDLEAGAVFTVEELLRALLLTSSNDSAVALAEHVSGTERKFVALMNRLARRLGAGGTHFVTAHGLDRPGHRSTARDLALLAAELLENPVLAGMVALRRSRIGGPEGGLLRNRNVLLKRYRGAIGVKTGYTAEAGDVLVAAAERGGRRLIAVALDAVNAASDARKLLDYGWSALRHMSGPALERASLWSLRGPGSWIAGALSGFLGLLGAIVPAAAP